MFKPISDEEVTEFATNRAVERTAEYARYPDLFETEDFAPGASTALVIGAAAKKLPRSIIDARDEGPVDETRFADQYGFGLGRMAALHLARRGWHVVGTYASSSEAARQLELMLRGHFRRAASRMYQLDVSDLDAVAQFATMCPKTHPNIRAVIYAPSVQIRKDRLEDVTRADLDTCMRGNCFAYAELMRVLLPRALSSPPDADGIRFRVAYVGSISGSGTPSPGRLAYCLSKAAGMEYTINLSAEHAPDVMAFNYNVSIADTGATANVREKYAPIMARESHYGRLLPAYEVARQLVTNLIDSSMNHGVNLDATGGWRRHVL